MSFSPSFTTSQVLGAPSNIVFMDTSTGSDGAIVGRRIYLKTSTGDFLVQSGNSNQYSTWALASNPFTLTDILTADKGLTVVVQWVNNSGVVLYDSTQTDGFILFNETDDYGLIQKMAGNPKLIEDNDWFNKLSLLRTYIDSGNQAISFASDTYNAQLCYSAATELIDKKRYVFNINS